MDLSINERIRNFNARDTKKWCRGKKGVPHQPEWKFLPPWDVPREGGGPRWATLVCAKCGKHLGFKQKKVLD